MFESHVRSQMEVQTYQFLSSTEWTVARVLIDPVLITLNIISNNAIRTLD